MKDDKNVFKEIFKMITDEIQERIKQDTSLSSMSENFNLEIIEIVD